MKANIMTGMKLGTIAIFTAMIMAACGSSSDSDMDEEPDLPEASGSELWQYMGDENYQNNWQLFPGTEELYEGTEPHGARLTIYVNDIAYDAIMSGGPNLPEGAIIVKENHMPDSTLNTITTMFKVEDYNPDHNDWFWLNNNPDGTINAEGRVDGCQSCHEQASATDYVFTDFPE